MTAAIFLILKGLILYTYIQFMMNVKRNLKKDSTLKFTVDLFNIIEIATVSALSMICLISVISEGSAFISVIAFVNLFILYYEGKRVILIGDRSIQIREELIYIKDITKIEAKLWTLHVHTKNREIKVMNPLVVSWKFQNNVYKKLKPNG